VQAHDQALCPQTAFTNVSPTVAFLQNLCCFNCAFQGPPKKDVTVLLLAYILPGPLVLITVIFFFFYFKRRAAQLSIRETKAGGMSSEIPKNAKICISQRIMKKKII